MVFTGSVDERALEALRGEETVAQAVASLLGVAAEEGERRAEQVLGERISMYAFRCAGCGRRRAHWDQD